MEASKLLLVVAIVLTSFALIPTEARSAGLHRSLAKLNEGDPVCFGARDNSYASIQISDRLEGNKVKAFILHHVDGYVACYFSAEARSNWGCGGTSDSRIRRINVYLTDKGNNVLVPVGIDPDHWHFYKLPGFTSQSAVLVLNPSDDPIPLPSELRVWYGEDLYDITEFDNNGKACVNVYAVFGD